MRLNCSLNRASSLPLCRVGPANSNGVRWVRQICVRRASQPIYLFDNFTFLFWLHSLFFCRSQSRPAACKDRRRPCACVSAQFGAPPKTRGQPGRRDGKAGAREMEGDCRVLSGIAKIPYDLNDKRRLSHALCISHCTCTVIPIKLSAGFSQVKDGAEGAVCGGGGRVKRDTQSEVNKAQGKDQKNGPCQSDGI